MFTDKLISQLAEHGDLWCLDVTTLPRFLGSERKTTPRIPKVKGRIAVIPLEGVIAKKPDFWSGSPGTDVVMHAIDYAMSSKSIGGVVLDIDSPGGSSAGLAEFSDKIYSYRGTKPIIAIANTLAASAAFWAGSSADQLIASTSAEIGSVGVWSMHMNYSGMLSKHGLEPTLISAGKYKVEGHPFGPLEDEAKAEFQRSVDECYGQFCEALARNRGVTKSTVLSDFGEGRVLGAKRAVERGMADRIETLDSLLEKMGGNQSRSGRERAALMEAQENLCAIWQGKPVQTLTHIESRQLALRQREKITT